MPTMLFAAIALLAATAPSPSPAPSPTEAPLREIGRVHVTTPLCKTLATHAVVAANLALEDDRKITLTLGTLRGVDLDKNIIAKNRGTDQIRRQYAALRAGAVQAESEMKKFREAVKEVTNAEQRAALETFANALDGALNRQKKLADDLGRYIAWLDAQEPLTDQERADMERSLLAGLNPATPSPFIRAPSQPQTFQNPFGNFALIPETLSHSAK